MPTPPSQCLNAIVPVPCLIEDLLQDIRVSRSLMSEQKRKWLAEMCLESQRKRRRLRGKQNAQNLIDDMPAVVKTRRVTAGPRKEDVQPPKELKQRSWEECMALANLK